MRLSVTCCSLRLLHPLCLVLALLIPHAVSAQSLIASWPFSGNANDGTGNGHNGTVNGNAQLTNDRFGNLNSAYNFDGIDDKIVVPTSTAFNRSQLTISVWVKFCNPIVNGALNRLLVGRSNDNDSGDSGYAIGILRSGAPAVGGIVAVGFSGGGLITAPNIQDGRWHNIVGVLVDTIHMNGTPSTNVHLYLDGQYRGVSVGPGNSRLRLTGNQQPLYIAGEPFGPSYFKGAIDDIRIYDSLLSSAQIAAIYNENNWPNITYPAINLSLSALGATAICPGDSTQLQATLSGSSSTLRWQTANGLNFSDSMNLRPWVRPNVTTTYTVIATSGEPCPEKRDTQRITIIVNQPPKPSAGQLAYLCRGDTMRLNANVSGGTAPFRYAWTPATTIDDATSSQPKVWPKDQMRYYVTVTDANGCTGRDSVYVTVYAPPAVNAGRDTVICRGSPVKLGGTGSSENRYAWSPRAGLSDSSVAQPLASPDTTTRYIVVVKASTGCIARDTVVVTVKPAATADAGADATICIDSSAVLGAASQAGYQYMWTPAAGLNNPATAQPVAKPSITTTYYLTATNASGCTAVDSVTVTVLKPALTVDQPTLDFGQLDGCTSSKDMPLVVTNNGDVEIRISDATFSGSGFSIVSPPRPIDLKPGEKVTLTVRYAPTGSGPASSTLTVSGSPCSVTARVDLKGSKEQSLVSADVASIDFGRSLSCTPTDSTVTITITNSGGVDATISTTALASPFSIDTPILPVTIPAGATQTIIIHYKPTAAGVYSGDLKLPYTSGTCHDTLRIALSGIVEQPELKPSTTMIDFGTLSGCEVGHDTTIVLSNSGTFDITIDSGFGIPAEPFRVTTALPLTIPAGRSRTITLRFEPASSGASSGPLVLHYSPCNGTINITLSGTKQGVSFSVPDSLDLGEVFSCREQSKSVSAGIIYSGDGGTGSVGSVSISGPFTTTLKAGDVLNSGAPLSFDVTFVPSQDGSATGFIDVTLEPCGITRRIELRGSYWSIALVPSSISFGTQPVGTLTTKPVLFINNSSVPMRIEQVEGIAPPFSIASTVPAVPATLPPGDTLHILMSYRATSGTSRDTLEADVTVPCSIVVDATLEGSGEEGATATVGLPIVEAVPGERITLPLMLKSSEGLDALGALRFTMDVSFNRTLLFPSGATPLGIEQGRERVVTISGERASGMSSGELARLEFIAALGDTTYTLVVIRSFRWLDATAQVHMENGGVSVTSQGGWKLFLSDGTLRLEVKPNPANQSAEIDYEVIEPGRTRLIVRDAVGREVQRLLDAVVKPGQYSIQHDVSQLAAGAYFYVLQTPSGKLVTPLVVVH